MIWHGLIACWPVDIRGRLRLRASYPAYLGRSRGTLDDGIIDEDGAALLRAVAGRSVPGLELTTIVAAIRFAADCLQSAQPRLWERPGRDRWHSFALHQSRTV